MNTCYWIFYSTQAGHCLCVCGRFGIRCPHVRNRTHWVNMHPVHEAEQSYFFVPARGFLHPVSCKSIVTPIADNVCRAYDILIEMGIEQLGEQNVNQGVTDVMIRARLLITPEYYPTDDTIQFTPHPMSHPNYGLYFVNLLSHQKYIAGNGESVPIPPYYVVHAMDMPRFTLSAAEGNLPIFRPPPFTVATPIYVDNPIPSNPYQGDPIFKYNQGYGADRSRVRNNNARLQMLPGTNRGKNEPNGTSRRSDGDSSRPTSLNNRVYINKRPTRLCKATPLGSTSTDGFFSRECENRSARSRMNSPLTTLNGEGSANRGMVIMEVQHIPSDSKSNNVQAPPPQNTQNGENQCELPNFNIFSKRFNQKSDPNAKNINCNLTEEHVQRVDTEKKFKSRSAAGDNSKQTHPNLTGLFDRTIRRPGDNSDGKINEEELNILSGNYDDAFPELPQPQGVKIVNKKRKINEPKTDECGLQNMFEKIGLSLAGPTDSSVYTLRTLTVTAPPEFIDEVDKIVVRNYDTDEIIDADEYLDIVNDVINNDVRYSRKVEKNGVSRETSDDDNSHYEELLIASDLEEERRKET